MKGVGQASAGGYHRALMAGIASRETDQRRPKACSSERIFRGQRRRQGISIDHVFFNPVVVGAQSNTVPTVVIAADLIAMSENVDMGEIGLGAGFAYLLQ